jgi:hypothetical protein
LQASRVFFFSPSQDVSTSCSRTAKPLHPCLSSHSYSFSIPSFCVMPFLPCCSHLDLRVVRNQHWTVVSEFDLWNERQHWAFCCFNISFCTTCDDITGIIKKWIDWCTWPGQISVHLRITDLMYLLSFRNNYKKKEEGK